MIDFLGAWNPRVHSVLHGFVDSMSDTIDNMLRQYGDHLSMYMWKDD